MVSSPLRRQGLNNLNPGLIIGVSILGFTTYTRGYGSLIQSHWLSGRLISSEIYLCRFCFQI
ncbi:hypothetical protein BDV26DRAFT_271946 [Aspergillus bertholletiae]|uniref:Uncharacterized protein n=1 Tax=Aspergillus bertholletiae TaxID=1226010 RepID=A0A5N7AUG6_9EURO|nr:hypothetical protein BDV26DRAFT_271946 [Aspergillus bertholletiae]